jgi:hypothetical protein
MAFLQERDELVLRELRARGIPIVINLAGGYIPEITARLHVQTIRAPRGLSYPRLGALK